jgi:hypothetical protein
MDIQKVTTEYRINHWSELIKECRSSCKTVSTWCQEHNINAKSYYYWLRKIRIAACNSIPDESNKQQLIVPLKIAGEVQPVFAGIKDETGENTQPAIVLRFNGAILEIQNVATISTIENTLKALKNLC